MCPIYENGFEATADCIQVKCRLYPGTVMSYPGMRVRTPYHQDFFLPSLDGCDQACGDPACSSCLRSLMAQVPPIPPKSE